MGFAVLENILNAYQYDLDVGIARAFTTVLAHAPFGITMGCFFRK
jgi:RsiW-degrading membrane proteinase PrsW (M82 family)